jgi:hypothetical protein
MRQSPARRVTAWQFTAEIPSSPAERQPPVPSQLNGSAPIERASQTMIDGQVVSPDFASAPNRESRSDVSASANLQPQPRGTQLCPPCPPWQSARHRQWLLPKTRLHLLTRQRTRPPLSGFAGDSVRQIVAVLDGDWPRANDKSGRRN